TNINKNRDSYRGEKNNQNPNRIIHSAAHLRKQSKLTSSRVSRSHSPSTGEMPQDIWPKSFRRLPPVNGARAEFCPSQGSPDSRAQIVYRNWVGSAQPRIRPSARNATNLA